MTNIEVEINDNYICVYERLNDDCIRLLHMYGKNPVCVVPDMLDGMRVSEIAEYWESLYVVADSFHILCISS